MQPLLPFQNLTNTEFECFIFISFVYFLRIVLPTSRERHFELLLDAVSLFIPVSSLQSVAILLFFTWRGFPIERTSSPAFLNVDRSEMEARKPHFMSAVSPELISEVPSPYRLQFDGRIKNLTL